MMDIVDELLLRADTVADGFMATSLDKLGEDAEQLEEHDVSALRETFKVAWLVGYRAGIEECFDA
jgi:hypothetical protein